jgi:hypothetical protein
MSRGPKIHMARWPQYPHVRRLALRTKCRAHVGADRITSKAALVTCADCGRPRIDLFEPWRDRPRFILPRFLSRFLPPQLRGTIG